MQVYTWEEVDLPVYWIYRVGNEVISRIKFNLRQKCFIAQIESNAMDSETKSFHFHDDFIKELPGHVLVEI